MKRERERKDENKDKDEKKERKRKRQRLHICIHCQYVRPYDFAETEGNMDRKSWEREIVILLHTKSIYNLNRKDWSCVGRINGQIKFKEKRKDDFKD